MKIPKTPAGRLGALRRARRTLRDAIIDHGTGCFCAICLADDAMREAIDDVQRPGWRAYITQRNAPESK